MATAALMLAASPAAAKDKPPRPAQVQQLYDCRSIGDAQQRLLCFDRQIGVLETAESSGDLTMIDRATAQKARRGLFGFTLRDLPFFGGGDDDVEAIKRLETVIKTARRGANGKWRFTIDDDALWVQTDTVEFMRDPKAGDKILIRPGAVGNYFAEVAGQKAIRIRRER